jgi:RecA/RadA recombinase
MTAQDSACKLASTLLEEEEQLQLQLPRPLLPLCSPAVDKALNGGLVYGRITTVAGPDPDCRALVGDFVLVPF